MLNAFYKWLAISILGFMGLIILGQITHITGRDSEPIMKLIEIIIKDVMTIFFKLLNVLADIIKIILGII